MPSDSHLFSSFQLLVGQANLEVASFIPEEALSTLSNFDSMSYRLDELLNAENPNPALPDICHGTRLGLIQHYLSLGREQGLIREDDLLTYVLMIARNGEALSRTPAWHEAISACREQGTPLSDAVQTHLRPAHLESHS